MQTSTQPAPGQEPTTVPSIPVGGQRKRSVSSNGHVVPTDSSTSAIVKSEPQSPEHITRRSPPAATKTSPAASISSKSSLSPPPNSKTPPYPSEMPDSKKRKVMLTRKSSETLRAPPPRKSSFGSPNDCSDDLKLSADDCHSITNSTTRLLRPLEETEATPTATSSSNGTASRLNSVAGEGTAPPQTTTPPQSTAEDTSLQHELDEFSKVMAQVTQEETAREKERQQGVAPYMMQFDLPNSPYLGSLSVSAPSPMYSTSQAYTQASGFPCPSNSYASMRQPSSDIGDPAYRYCGPAHAHQKAQLDSVYAPTVPIMQQGSQGSQQLYTSMTGSQTSLVSSSPFSDHAQNISLGNQQYRQISSLSSPLDHYPAHHLSSPHPSYGHGPAGYGYVGPTGVASVGPEWSQLPMHDAMLGRVDSHPEAVAYMVGKMPPTASAIRAGSNVQHQMSRQYQSGYTAPGNQPFPHTISYGRFSSQM